MNTVVRKRNLTKQRKTFCLHKTVDRHATGEVLCEGHHVNMKLSPGLFVSLIRGVKSKQSSRTPFAPAEVHLRQDIRAATSRIQVNLSSTSGSAATLKPRQLLAAL
jgi:hypothetical protein